MSASTQDTKKINLDECKYIRTRVISLGDDGDGSISLYKCNDKYALRYFIKYGNKIYANAVYYYKYEREGIIVIPITENSDAVVCAVADQIQKIYETRIRELYKENKELLKQLDDLYKKFREARRRKLEEFSNDINNFDIAKFIEAKLKIHATIISDKIEENRIRD